MNSISARKLYHDRTETSIRIRKVASKSPVKLTAISNEKLSTYNSISPIKPIKSFSDPQPNEKLTESFREIQKFSLEIYEAKCKDLQIFPLEDHERRFSSIFINNFNERKVDLQDSKISLQTCRALIKCFQTYPIAHINLSKNKLTDKGISLVCKALLSNLSLVSLDLTSTDLSPAGSQEVLELLSKHQSLYSLNLSSHQFLYRNKIGFCESLIGLLKSETLTFLNLAGTSLGNEGLKYLIIGLEHNQVLNYLNISSNNIKGLVIKEFSQVIVTTRLSEVHMAGNQFDEQASDEISFLLLGLYGYGVLSKLNLGYNQIDSQSASKIFEAMIKENYLEHLNLENNNLSGDLDIIERFLQNNKRLKTLSLSNCNLKINSFLQICSGLGRNSSLEYVNLCKNNCRDSGAIGLSKALLTNSTLAKLDLSSNKIYNIGGVSIANSLKTNKSLKVLNLNDNELKDEVGEAFFYIFGVNYTLVNLHLHLNPMSAKYPLDIKKYLERNRAIHEKKIIQKILDSKNRKAETSAMPDQIESRLKENLDQKQNLEKKIGNYMKKLTGIKKENDEQLEELQEKVKDLKTVNIELSKTLNDLQLEMKVIKNQQLGFNEDKKVDEIEVKMLELDQELKTLSEKSKNYSGKALDSGVKEKKTSLKTVYEDLNNQLAHARQEKGYLSKHLLSLKKVLNDKKSFITGISRSAARTPRRLPSKYLSSEKLRKITKSKSPLTKLSSSRIIISKV